MARKTTIGVYIRANFLMNNSVFDFLAVAFCTISRIRAMELSLNSFVVSISITPSRLMLPAKTLSPLAIVLGLLSPVKAAVLKEPFSDSRIPSSGTFSPTRTCIFSPISTVSGFTETKSSSPSIASTMAKFKKLYSGASSGTPISSASLSEAAAEVTGEKEEEKEESVAAVNVPDYKLPSYSGSSNKGASINFGSGKGGVKVVGKKTATKQENLSNFKVNTGEINENQDASIFKLLSNRYLMKFPVLLEEVKK